MSSAVQNLVNKLKAASCTVAAAESCSGGLIADAFARIPGASGVFWGSFVSYMNEAKQSMLGIPRGLIEKYGAVSAQTAQAMALGALEKSSATAALSVTGIAGPDGDGSGAPVGAVWISAAFRGKKPVTKYYLLAGSRAEIREEAARRALELLDECLDSYECRA